MDPHVRWPKDISELEDSSCASPLPGDQSNDAMAHRQRKAERHRRNREKFQIAQTLDERKARKSHRRQEQRSLHKERRTRLGLPSKSSRRAAAKRRRESNFATLLAGGTQKMPRTQPERAGERLTPEERMKAFDEAERAKGHRGWWRQSDSEDDEPSRPGRFRPQSREASQPPERRQAERPQAQSPGNIPVAPERIDNDPAFIVKEVGKPMDSAGHDEVVYVGSAGGTPQRMATAIDEMKASLQTQEALLSEAKIETDERAKLESLLGKEEAALYAAFKAEQKRAKQTTRQSSRGQEPRSGPSSSSEQPTRRYFRIGGGRGGEYGEMPPQRRAPLQLPAAGPSQATRPLTVVPPAVHDVNGWWDSLGAFHDRWQGTYFKGYYFPAGGKAPYRAEMPQSALRLIPGALRPVFQAQQEALKIHVPDAQATATEW